MERKVNLMGMNMIIWGEAMMQEEYGRVIMWLVFIVCLMVIEIITKVIQEYNNQNLHLAIVRTETINELLSILKNLNKLGITTDIFDPIIKRLTNKNE
jgi:phage-related holin